MARRSVLARLARRRLEKQGRKVASARHDLVDACRAAGIPDDRIGRLVDEIGKSARARKSEAEILEESTRRVAENHKKGFGEIIEACRELGHTDEEITLRLEALVEGFRESAAQKNDRALVDRLVGEIREDYRARIKATRAA